MTAPSSSLSISSPAFDDGQPIPVKYTCNADNISPPLIWKGLPPDSKSLALIADDPDAPMGIWTHWVIYNIPPHRLDFLKTFLQMSRSKRLAPRGKIVLTASDTAALAHPQANLIGTFSPSLPSIYHQTCRLE